MKPSPELKSLLESGAIHGWGYHERRLAASLIAVEGSGDLLDSFRREITFLHAEQILPAANVQSLARAMAHDPGARGKPGFSHEITGRWPGSRAPASQTQEARRPLHATEAHTRKSLVARLGVSEAGLDLLLGTRVLKPISQCGPTSWRFSAREIQNIKELTAK